MKIHRAKQLPQETGPAAWREIIPEIAQYPKLDDNVTADIVIIGAGFAGISAARTLKLLDAKLKIVLLEASKIAEGASGRNSGFMIDIPHDLSSDDYAGKDSAHDKTLIKLNRHAIDFAKQAVQTYKINPNYFDPAGKINGAVTAIGDAHNRSFAKHLAAMGEKSEMLDSKAMFEITGSRYYSSGLYTPGTVMLQPAGYVQSFVSGLSAHNKIQIFEQSPVVSFAKQGKGKGWQVKTASGAVTCEKIILANNGHLESFGFAQRRLMHIFLYASMSPDLDKTALKKLGGQARWGITPSDPLGTTVRRIDNAQGGNRIIIRSATAFCPKMRASQMAFGRAGREHQKRFDDRFPQLAGLKMQYRWAGQLCMTRGDLSIMREIDANLFTACCQNGLGVARGTFTGIAAANLLMGQKNALTDFFANKPLPAKIPPAPLSTIGANLYLRFQEYQARKE